MRVHLWPVAGGREKETKRSTKSPNFSFLTANNKSINARPIRNFQPLASILLAGANLQSSNI